MSDDMGSQDTAFSGSEPDYKACAEVGVRLAVALIDDLAGEVRRREAAEARVADLEWAAQQRRGGAS